MKISIGADHGGFELKVKLVEFIKSLNYELIDNGTFSSDSVDYPDFAKLVAKDILEKRADFGVLICGSGIGISVAANRFKGIRAALVTREEFASLSREHNNANVIVFGGRFTSFEDAKTYLKIFLSTDFQGGRHQKRVEKIDAV
ncbi:MAG: ribose 5-phosphate isomerase B [bacterium]